MIHTRIKDVDLKFETESSILSPNCIDNGTLEGELIGEERVIMCDISERAVELATINAALNGVPHINIRLSDGYQNVEENDFTLILCNPPYNTDFSVPKKFIEVGFRKLAMGGKLWLPKD